MMCVLMTKKEREAVNRKLDASGEGRGDVHEALLVEVSVVGSSMLEEHLSQLRERRKDVAVDLGRSGGEGQDVSLSRKEKEKTTHVDCYVLEDLGLWTSKLSSFRVLELALRRKKVRRGGDVTRERSVELTASSAWTSCSFQSHQTLRHRKR